MTMKPKLPIGEVLDLASALIERGWCQHDWVQDEKGKGLLFGDPQATRWCLKAAIGTITGPDGMYVKEFVDTALGEDLSKWNDTRGRSQMEVLLKIKELARSAHQRAEG